MDLCFHPSLVGGPARSSWQTEANSAEGEKQVRTWGAAAAAAAAAGGGILAGTLPNPTFSSVYSAHLEGAAAA